MKYNDLSAKNTSRTTRWAFARTLKNKAKEIDERDTGGDENKTQFGSKYMVTTCNLFTKNYFILWTKPY